MKYLIEANKPFAGHCLSVIAPDGTVAYTDGLTVEEYESERRVKVRVVDCSEFAQLIKDHEESLKTDPKHITASQYDYALEVLPPRRWHDVGSWSVHHVSERITGNLVNWYATNQNGAHYEWIDDARITDEQILIKLP